MAFRVELYRGQLGSHGESMIWFGSLFGLGLLAGFVSFVLCARKSGLGEGLVMCRRGKCGENGWVWSRDLDFVIDTDDSVGGEKYGDHIHY